MVVPIGSPTLLRDMTGLVSSEADSLSKYGPFGGNTTQSGRNLALILKVVSDPGYGFTVMNLGASNG